MDITIIIRWMSFISKDKLPVSWHTTNACLNRTSNTSIVCLASWALRALSHYTSRLQHMRMGGKRAASLAMNMACSRSFTQYTHHTHSQVFKGQLWLPLSHPATPGCGSHMHICIVRASDLVFKLLLPLICARAVTSRCYSLERHFSSKKLGPVPR